MDYVHEYKDYAMKDMPNCLCGDKGKNRNEKECQHRKSCDGCGFDREEHFRRVVMIRTEGLKPLGEERKELLRKKYGANTQKEISALILMKRDRDKGTG